MITNVLYKDKRHNTFKIQRTLKEYSCTKNAAAFFVFKQK